VGPVIGAFGVNWLQSILTTNYPDLWLLVLGGLFVGVVLFFPDGIVGSVQRLLPRLERSAPRRPQPATFETPHRGPLPKGEPGA
jgi:urea transport system permease protein